MRTLLERNEKKIESGVAFQVKRMRYYYVTYVGPLPRKTDYLMSGIVQNCLLTLHMRWIVQPFIKLMYRPITRIE